MLGGVGFFTMISAKFVQLSKSQYPILVIELGKVTEVRLEQPKYLQLAICQLVLIKTVEK